MTSLSEATLFELVKELQARAKGSLIAVVSKRKSDRDNPDDDVDLFVEGSLADRGWLLTALQSQIMEDIRESFSLHNEGDTDG